MGRHFTSIQSYDEAAAFLAAGRASKVIRPVAGLRSTTIERLSDEAIGVKYHGTYVVKYFEDGRRQLDSGGWRTPTTKQRIGDFTDVRLYASKGVWYVGGEPQIVFYDGITVNAAGEPIHSEAAQRRQATELKVRAKLDKLVREYIKGFAAHVVANGLEAPSGGDCWGCAMQVKDAPQVDTSGFRRQAPTPHGRVEPMGLDHYLSHFKERYFVPSLLLNAIVSQGYRDPGYIWHMIAADAKRGDTAMLRRILRGYFMRLKPALVSAGGVR